MKSVQFMGTPKPDRVSLRMSAPPTPVERLRAFYRQERERLFDEVKLLQDAVDSGVSPVALAAELGIGKSTIYDKLKLARLSGAARNAVIEGWLNQDVASAIASLSHVEQNVQMKRLAGLSTREALKKLRHAR
ncbi:MAG: hypothetical protein IPJ65_07210 [Archangiaceae bacterium]|nr:hypothetical protein [Archangiaceae bacterium]